MKALRSAIPLFGIIAALILGPALAAHAQERSEEPVKILVLKKKPFGVSPEALTVQRGTTLIWFNKDPEPVTVAFMQPLGPVCKMPVNFYTSLEGILTTGLIPQSGIASLCIVEPGSYDFKVWRLLSKPGEKTSSEMAAGKIAVE